MFTSRFICAATAILAVFPPLYLPPRLGGDTEGGNAEVVTQHKARLIGRWDLTVQSPQGAYPSWLEVRRSGHRTLVGAFVGRFGSARPIGQVHVDHGRLHFSIPPQWEDREDDLVFDGKLEGDLLSGETTDEKGQRLTWTARRAPALKRSQAPTWGEPIELFNGQDLTGCKPRWA